jgi:hypothetical protein
MRELELVICWIVDWPRRYRNKKRCAQQKKEIDNAWRDLELTTIILLDDFGIRA